MNALSVRNALLLVVSLIVVACAIRDVHEDPIWQACSNGKLDNDETDVDCGGTNCPSCAEGKKCSLPSDCSLGNCVDGKCNATPCTDLKQDGNETAIDCGGANQCPRCSNGQACLVASDCSGGICLNKFCNDAPCQDGKQDGKETAIDCGGGQCPGCGDGKACLSGSDCAANTPCTNGKCENPLCHDSKLDGAETDIDCGGSCAACPLDKTCSIAADCESLNCDSGTCAPPNCHDNSRNGLESGIDCGDAAGICPLCGTGMTCTVSSTCVSNHCANGVCAAPTCADTITNGTETDKDCGGSCSPCADGMNCSTAADCLSKVCQGGKCQIASCSDGVRNGQETGKDCGGSCLLLSPAQKCPNGEGCSANSDCIFSTCTNGLCEPPTCSNGVLDAGETDIDCGGNCSPCADLLKCTTGQDCQSKACNASTKTCDKPSCTDAVQNGNETDVNCGGVTCTQRCLNGKRCLSDSDCQSKVCDSSTLTCVVPTCSDGVQNGTETGQDCGGSCAMMSPAKTCGTGVTCGVDADCTSSICCTASSCGALLNECSKPSCIDGKKNQGESGIDCGGNALTTGCALRCGPGDSCQAASDCDSGVCKNLVCQAPSCTDTVQNGNEIGTDCGGNCPKGCPAGTPCKGPGDCDSSVCQKDSATGAYTTCAAATCSDGVKNGGETFTDCGGGCKGCAQGQPCAVQTDCDLSITGIDCINKICAKPQCNDQVQDGSETDVDCGGGTCKKCADTKLCSVAIDCNSNHCAADATGTMRCAVPTCTDVVQNQGESGTDCGGTSSCARCGTGLGCTMPTDCLNSVCGSSNTCSAPTCGDTVQNQQETDVDCGGPNCSTSTTACASGKICKVNTDCLEVWCVISTGTTGTCTHPTCSDTILNGTESDVDCGGSCPSKCSDAQKCNKDLDCANGWCNSGKCATPACTDSTQNGTETGKDCGGNCAAPCSTLYDSNCKQCADNTACKINDDCLSLNCASNVCATPTGTTPAACVGKVLEGTCNQCATAASPSNCKTYLMCMYKNSCVPGTLGAPNPCADSAKNGICSLNKVNKTQEALNAAINAYNCACP